GDWGPWGGGSRRARAGPPGGLAVPPPLPPPATARSSLRGTCSWAAPFLPPGAARSRRRLGDLGYRAVAHERNGRVGGGEVPADEERRDAVGGRPAGACRRVERGDETAHRRDRGDPAANAFVPLH